MFLGRTNAAEENAYRHFAVFSDVIAKIKSEYVEEPDMKNVTLGALNGLLEAIDPYASYLNADQYKQYLKTKETKKAGLGMVLARRFGYVAIVDAIPGSPAAKLGIASGDIIETITGVSTRDMPLAYAEMLLLGDPGSTIEMGVIRVRKSAEAQKIQLMREVVRTPAITAKIMSNEVGYIEVHSLEKGKAGEIGAKIEELGRQGAKRFVLDLRDNAVGSIEEGMTLANLFLDKGLITYLQGQKVPRKDFPADASKAVYKQPLSIITNRGTAGGAEIAAAALLDNKRAEVVGERSNGDAAERKVLTMEDGSAVILAIAKYYSPNGKAIQDHAVVPSLMIAGPDPDPDPDDDASPAPQRAPKSNEDLQLKKAIEVVTVGIQAAKASDPKTAAQTKAGEGGSTLRPLNIPRPPQ